MSTQNMLFGPKKNEEFIFMVTLADPSDADVFVSNPTLTAGDVKVSTDGGSFANAGTLPSVTPVGGVGVKVTLTASEMNGDYVLVYFTDTTGTQEWQAHSVSIVTRTVDVDDLVRSTTPANTLTVDANNGCMLAQTTHTSAVIPTVSVLTGHTAQTGDSYARIGAPAGASVSADTAAIKADTGAILVDTDALDGRLTSARGTKLDNLDAAMTTRSAPATSQNINMAQAQPGSPTADTVGEAIKAITDNIDVVLSTRASATDFTSARGAKLDNLDALVSSRSAPATAQTINLTTSIASSNTAQTIGGALKISEAAERYRINTDASVRTQYDKDATTPLVTRTQTSTELTP